MARDVNVRIKGENAVGKVFRDVGTDAERMGKTVETSATRSAKSLEEMQRRATAVGAGLGTLVGIASAAGQAHQSEERQLSALNRVYGESAAEIDNYAQKLQDMGIASDDAVRIAALGAQSLTKNYGLTTDEIEKLIERSADLSQTTFDQYGNQLGLADVMQRVQAAIRGEAESAEILGVAMNDQRLAALAAAEGMTGWNTTMTDAEKAAFRLRVFLDDTSTAQGAAAERSETLAGQINAMKLEVLDATAAFGGMIGPVGEVTAVLGDAALAAPLVGAGFGKLAGAATALGGTAGLAGVATALTAVGAATVALAAPVGIATFLFVDQKNVIKEATEVTLANQDALEGYITYLKSIDVSDTAVTEMTQQMKELLDWATKTTATGFEALIDPDLNGPAKAFVVTLGDMNDELRGLNPENLQQVQRTMHDLGIDMRDPSTWNSDNIAIVTELIYLLSRAENDAEQTTMELSRANGLNAMSMEELTSATDKARQAMFGYSFEAQNSIPVIDSASVAAHDAQRAFADWTEGQTKHGHAVTDVTAALKDEEQQANHTGDAFAEMTEQQRAAAQAAIDLYESLGLGNLELDAMAQNSATVADNIGIAAGKAHSELQTVFRVIVGNTNAIGSTVDGVMRWADELINVEGQYGKIDDLRSQGLITEARYDMAQRAYNRMAKDSADIQTDILQIQAMQAPVVANAIRNQERYLDNVVKIGEEEGATAQTAALGWMDAAEAQENLTIATELGAAANTKYGSTARASMEAYIQGIIATDPVQTAMLEKQGLIFQDKQGNWQINWDNADEINTAMDDLVSSLQDLVEVLEVEYKLDFNGDGVIGANDLVDQLKDSILDTDNTDATIDVNDDSVLTAHDDINLARNALSDLDGSSATVTVDANTTSFWNKIGGIPQIVGDRYINVHGIGFDAEVATGGMVRFATGGMARLAEQGPELLHYPNGATGLAMRDGMYAIPNGTMVDTAPATRDKLRGMGGGQNVITGNTIIVYPPTADVHDAIVSAALNQGT